MRDAFANYDAWLEKPYQDMYAAGDAYVDFCEREGLDPDTPEAQSAWAEYQDYMQEPESPWDTDKERELELADRGYYDD